MGRFLLELNKLNKWLVLSKMYTLGKTFTAIRYLHWPHIEDGYSSILLLPQLSTFLYLIIKRNPSKCLLPVLLAKAGVVLPTTVLCVKGDSLASSTPALSWLIGSNLERGEGPEECERTLKFKNGIKG